MVLSFLPITDPLNILHPADSHQCMGRNQNVFVLKMKLNINLFILDTKY